MIAPAVAVARARRLRGDEGGNAMRSISVVVLCAALLLPGVANAGWGAIAYNPATGASTEVHGQAHLSTALNGALNACGNGCLLVTWEHNTCIAFATDGRGAWGDAFNESTYQAATSAAVSACGAGCSWRVWACS
jgi:hypothetical protein